jgi:hypothetical protein
VTSTPLYGVVSQTRGGHLLDRLVDVGHAAGVKDDEHWITLVRPYGGIMARGKVMGKLNYGRTLNLAGAADDVACQRVKQRAVRNGRGRKQVTRR